MPYLDEWAAFEMDYSVSLSEAIQALLNASLQVPISGDVRVRLALFLLPLSGLTDHWSIILMCYSLTMLWTSIAG